MHDHQLEGVRPRPLAQRRIECDVAAEQRLDHGAEIAHNAAGAHDDTAHHPNVANDPVAGEVVGGGDKHATCPFGQETCPISRVASLAGSSPTGLPLLVRWLQPSLVVFAALKRSAVSILKRCSDTSVRPLDLAPSANADTCRISRSSSPTFSNQ